MQNIEDRFIIYLIKNQFQTANEILSENRLNWKYIIKASKRNMIAALISDKLSSVQLGEHTNTDHN